MSLKVSAPAKINLALDVLGKEENGMHTMDMVNARADLADILWIEKALQDEIICPGFVLPTPNTLSKTLELLRQYGLKDHYKITLEKHIPDQAGLGGGSADAAALLKALNELEKLNLSLEKLETIGFKIGADVPCCLHSGFTRVKGAGEKVEDLEIDWQIPVLFVKGKEGISTKQAFLALDETLRDPLDIDIVQDAVRKKDLGLLYQTMTNAFEPIAFNKLPLAQLKEKMLDAGLVRVMMSGSGSCLMGFCVDEDVLDQAYKILQEENVFVWKGRIQNV